jgi:hypothetical protein
MGWAMDVPKFLVMHRDNNTAVEASERTSRCKDGHPNGDMIPISSHYRGLVISESSPSGSFCSEWHTTGIIMVLGYTESSRVCYHFPLFKLPCLGKQCYTCTSIAHLQATVHWLILLVISNMAAFTIMLCQILLYVLVYMHTCIHAYMHTCIHAYMHTYIHTYICILYIYIFFMWVHVQTNPYISIVGFCMSIYIYVYIVT